MILALFWSILLVVGEEFCCLDLGVAKDFVADSVVEGSNSGVGDIS